MTIKNCAYAAGFAASLVLLAACGDDVTEVTKVSESASLDQVEKFKKLPKCEDEIEGSLVYVKDSAKVYACTGDGWIQVNGKDGQDGKSGKDGSDGKDGKSGKDGKDGEDGSGSSCSVTAAKDGSFDVKCDGKTVGTLKSGSDGKSGKDGTSCTAKESKDGYDLVCDGKTVGTLKNGKDGGDGEDGDDCSLTQDANGAVTVKCGKKTATLFKAVCGSASYDPETQFCYGSVVDDSVVMFPAPRCKDWSEVDPQSDGLDFSSQEYDALEQFCDEKGVLHDMCEWEDDDGKRVRKTFAWNEYCDAANKKIAKKVACAEGSSVLRKPTEYCYTTNDNSKVRFAELETCGSGNNETKYNPVTHFCKKNSAGELGEKSICAQTPAKADKFNIDIRYMAEESMDDHTSQICDTRDYQIYGIVTVDGKTWMTQNLNYRKVVVVKGVEKVQPTSSLDSSSFCMKDNGRDNRGDCSNGRLYLWSAAIDSIALASGVSGKKIYCGYGENDNCELPETVQGVCPDGWRLPSNIEAEIYPSAYTGKDGGFMYFQNSLPIFDKNTTLYFWSATEADATNAYRYMGGSVATNGKNRGYSVRCIKNSAAAPAAPAGE